MILRILFASVALVCALVPGAPLRAQSGAQSTATRHYYLDNLIRPHNYVPGKNSFLVQNMHRGEKKTLLELTGRGSVRHLWSTWSIPGDDSDIPAPHRVQVRIFVDGQAQPSVTGFLDELCRAAEATGSRFVPLPAFNYKGAFNFYLPIFFDRGVRVEVEAADEIQEFYAQIDYRTENAPPPRSRLISDDHDGILTLRYVDGDVSARPPGFEAERSVQRTKLLEYSERPAELRITGPGILRELIFHGNDLDDIELEIYWDDDKIPDVEAPLHYFFADFTNAAMESSSGQRTCYFPMPFEKRARILVRSLSRRPGRVIVDYSIDPQRLPADTLYFRAQYHETEGTLGHAQYSVLRLGGQGLFVGLNLFDSGHNHGGGDAALIDGGTASPLVLHGICGEDYFGFAWHHFGTMTPLTGAPAHERRYRLHLENPYPFHESMQFLFGIFAGQHPKSVAFWYQAPDHAKESRWRTLDIPWKILGPADVNSALPNAVSDATLVTTVPINVPTELHEQWQDTTLQAGFLDATYQFRHYAMTERGTGFVAGAGKTQLVTWVHVTSARNVRAILGHDDRAGLRVNDGEVVDIPARTGFGPQLLTLRLQGGWNKLTLILYNNENVNWRWCGFSLAFDRDESRYLRFAARPD
jgi:hypothetical protein